MTRFDESLPAMAAIVEEKLGRDAVEKSVFIRDATGRLSVMLATELEPGLLHHLADVLHDRLGAYSRSDSSVVRDTSDFSAEHLLQEALSVGPTPCGDYLLRLLDRRVVGADWLRAPRPRAEGIPRVAFSSLKGGVGRSTALSVVAAYLSRRGKRVLAVDLDLEAPGIGSLLLETKILPPFGSLDYLVENGISGVDNDFVIDVKAQSYLGSSGGQVTVVPAIGSKTVACPLNALSKISRAYVEDIDTDGRSVPFTDQVCEMIDRLADPNLFDVVLVDARAGLHETTAAVILGLGADVLLFGVDEPQTYLGYRLLLSHLVRFPVNADDDWRDRLHFVHAKASDSEKKQKEAEERFRDLAQIIYPPSAAVATVEPLTEDDFDLNWALDANINEIISSDDGALLRILDDARYRDFDPVTRRDLLEDETFMGTFSSLLQWFDFIVDNPEE